MLFFIKRCFVTVFLLSVSSELQALKSSNELLVSYSKQESFVVKEQNGVLAGLDISIIEHFAKKINHSIKYFERNSTDIGMNTFDMKKIDIFIGALDGDFLQNEQVIASRVYYHDEITWCVQVKHPIPSWKSLFYMCRDPLVYVLYTLMCTSVLFTGFFLQQYEDLQPKWNWFRLTFAGIAPCLGHPSEYRPKIIPNRIFFVMSLLGATLSYIICNSFFLLFIQTPIYEKQINSIAEIKDHEFDLAGDEFALQHLISQSETYPSNRLRHFHACDDLNECLLQLNWNSELAVAVSRELVRNSRHHIKAHCFESPNTIHSYGLKFLVRRDFTYIQEINAFIATASERGLVERWHSGRRMKYRKISKEHNYITKDGFMTIYYIWHVISVTSILVLVCELVIFRKVRYPNSGRIWKISERIIDPFRHYWTETILLNGNPAF